MKYIISSISFSLLIFACSNGTEESEALKDQIVQFEKKVSQTTLGNSDSKDIMTEKSKLADALYTYYRQYPDDPYAANCLSKLHMLYSGMNETDKAVAYADTLLERYPDFIDRLQVIESQIISYELDVRPRNVKMIKKYIKLWLKENTSADHEKIDEMNYHLEHVDLSLEERIKLNLEDF